MPHNTGSMNLVTARFLFSAFARHLCGAWRVSKRTSRETHETPQRASASRADTTKATRGDQLEGFGIAIGTLPSCLGKQIEMIGLCASFQHLQRVVGESR